MILGSQAFSRSIATPLQGPTSSAGGTIPREVLLLQHLRHQFRAISYNQRALLQPRKAASLIGAWYRNQAAYLRRTRAIARVLDIDADTIDQLLDESVEVMAHCTERSREYSALLPGLLNPNFGPVLYAVVRALRPEVVVETGVGSGVSSTFFLSAMERNSTGRLYSVDLPLPEERLLPEGERSGWMVPDRLRDSWELTLGDSRQELPALFERLGDVDGFFHDSDHSFDHMTWEFALAYPYVSPGGVVLSDDITSNDAWDEFASQNPGRSARINRTGFHRKPAA